MIVFLTLLCCILYLLGGLLMWSYIFQDDDIGHKEALIITWPIAIIIVLILMLGMSENETL